MKAHFVRQEWENQAHTIATFYFKPDKPYYFTAGQYADFSLPQASRDPRGPTRTMTIMTNPSDPLIGFTTRVQAHNSDYKQALLGLTSGDSVSVTDPMGDLVLPLDTSIPLVYVAGGLAIASYVSMIRLLTERHDARQVTLLYAARNRADIIFQDDFDSYAAVGPFRKVLFTSDTAVSADEWSGEIRRGRVRSTDIMEFLPRNGQVYLSGTEPMVEQLRRELERDHKVEQYRIAFDYYEGYSEL